MWRYIMPKSGKQRPLTHLTCFFCKQPQENPSRSLSLSIPPHLLSPLYLQTLHCFLIRCKLKKIFWRKDLILLRILLSLNLLSLGEWLSTTLVQISNPLICLFSPVQVHHSRATWYHKVLFVFLMILAVRDLQSSFMHYLIWPSYQL